jgi:hypothetical protein
MSHPTREVVGRDLLIRAIRRELPPKVARRLVGEIYDAGYVFVPREPTDKMLDAAYYYALDEDARGVWLAMVAESEKDQLKDREVGDGSERCLHG